MLCLSSYTSSVCLPLGHLTIANISVIQVNDHLDYMERKLQHEKFRPADLREALAGVWIQSLRVY